MRHASRLITGSILEAQERFRRSSNPTCKQPMMTRQKRIDDLKVCDNTGMLDGLDLANLSEEDFSKLEEEVFEYSASRAKTWEQQFTQKKKD